jgi:hypothetical protein
MNYRLSRSRVALMLVAGGFILSCEPAQADAGVPMLMVVWPCAWILLLAVVPIEAAVAVRLLNIGWKKGLVMVGVANLASTLVGIPATWGLLAACQMALGGGGVIGLQTTWTRILSVTLQSPWLIPYEHDLPWMIPTAAAVLCVPFFFMSVLSEYLCARFFVSPNIRPMLWRWSWIANGVTYGCIVIGLISISIWVLQEHYREPVGERWDIDVH